MPKNIGVYTFQDPVGHFEAVFIFEVNFIFEVVFIFEVDIIVEVVFIFKVVFIFEVVFGPLMALPMVPLMSFHRGSIIGLPMQCHCQFLANTDTHTQIE